MNEFDRAAAQVAQSTEPSDPFEVAASQVVDDQRTALRSTLYNALLESPDVAARAVQLGRKSGLPSEVVQRNLPEVQRNVQLDEFDRVLDNSPTVAQWLTEQNNAKIAHDDVENLGALDSALQFFRNTGNAVVSATRSRSAGVVGLVQAPFDLAAPLLDPLVGNILPGNPLRATAEGLSRYRQGIDLQAQAEMPKGGNDIEQGFYSGVGSLVNNLLALPMAFLPGGQGAALTAMTAPVAGQEFGKARDEGMSPVGAASFGASQAVIEYATEKLPLARLLGDVKAGTPLFKTIARQAALEVPGEQLATILQDLNEWAALNPDKPFSSYIEERPSAAAQTLVATLVGVGGQVTVAKGIEAAVQRIETKVQQADRAERSAEALEQLDKLAAASKVRTRDADTFEQFVAQATEDAPIQDVFIAANLLNQSGMAEALAAVSPSVREQYVVALETGGDIRIPVAEYTARIAGTELNQGLLDNLKTEPGGFSRAEAQEFMQSQAAELEAEVETALAAKAEDDTFKASAEIVKTRVREQLDQVRRFTGSVNDAYATMVGNFYAVMGAKIGVSPEQLFERYPLRIQAESVVGAQVLEQESESNQPTDSGSANILNQNARPKRDDYTLDLFEVPEAARPTDATGPDQSPIPRDMDAPEPVQRDDSPGVFGTKTKLVKEVDRTLGSSQVNTPEDAATALAYLARNAVERFDALVTDANGKPLAVVGSFKGKINATAVYPSTLIGEAFRIQGAANIWVAHNHPSGNPEFSQADLRMTEELARAFDGSQIKFQGMFAIAGAANSANRPYSFTLKGQGTDQAGSTRKPDNTAKVPAVERVFDEDAKLSPVINGPAAAKQYIPKVANGETGVVLLDAQNQAVAFVPLQADELAPLRQDGRMDALYRAVSIANAAGAMVVRNDNAYSDEGLQNVGGLLNSLEVRVLDVLDRKDSGGFDSWAETGKQIASASFYQKRNDGARGSFNPATNTVTLLKNADLSTFLHESGHFFLETQFDIAARLQQEASAFGAETNQTGEQQVLQDTNTVLQWFGIRDLSEWNNLDFEEKRSYHEKFARGFEAYVFEGKAPSIELQGLFQRFRAWLVNIYRDLRNLNVELTDEVRGVFDRMLASTEQIQLAEQGRSMVPLFTAPEQVGMTPDEFAAYQALGTDATNDAIQDVQARTLRDLAWTRSARGREIRRLQKEAAERRREVAMDVRREVMGQPVYRAWQFLTGKLTAQDRIDPITPRKSDPNVLDTTQDSLFTAIAKLGGLSKDEVVGTWGTDPADKPASGVFGKPVWRVQGGRTIDDMLESLAEAGYLTRDENGKADVREFEEKFGNELRGSPQFADAYVPERDDLRAGDQVINRDALGAGRLDVDGLTELDLPADVLERIQAQKMTAKNGLHPDVVAEMFNFSSGDQLVRTIAAANPPGDEIEGLIDARMLEQYGELATPEAIERAADKAIHNEARARFVATEANALAKATGQPRILARSARDFADTLVARLKVRNIRPGQYANAEARAAKAAQKASQSGDLATAAAEKRNQLVNTYATRAAYNAQTEIETGLRYLRKFESESTRKGLDADYTDQIDGLLERFDLRKGVSLRVIDKRKALAEWIAGQREQGLEPDVPAVLENEAFRKSYKDMTVEEFRGLVDTIKQIEHLGRLKNRLLTAADNRTFDAIKQTIVESIEENAKGRTADTRTPTTNLGRTLQSLKRFYASHVKAASWARILDGGKDGGPMWEYFIRAANEKGDMETQMRADATAELSKILSPVFKQGRMGGKGKYFPTIGRSLNREARLAIALNTGNEGNLQRLLGGEGWSEAQIVPVLQSLSQEEWAAVQAIWDHFETYRPQIAAKERRVYGKEPNWVEPGSKVTEMFGLKGGYYPIKYDPQASQRAEEFSDAEDAKRQLQGAFTSATTRRSFTKARTEEVKGRPLLYTLGGVYSGVNDVIHDLAWHEWLIDTNRLMRSQSIDKVIRTRYGPEVKQQFKQWTADIAEGDRGAQNAGEAALSRLRQGVSAAGLGFNVMSAAMQITGFNQSIVRVGARYIGRGISQYIASPVGKSREVVGKSKFMADRSRTQFRELNELRNRVQDENATMRNIRLGTYFFMMRIQRMVDIPTWLGAYEKAVVEGNDEDRAISLADQAVIDSQGSGMTKDLSGIERGGPALKLFTVFYSYMNTAFNMGVVQTMTAKSKGKLAADYLMLFTVPAVLSSALKDALTPGGDDDEEDLEALARRLAAEQLSYLMGLMVVVREFSNAAQIVTGAEGGFRDYTGPAGVRVIGDSFRFTTQATQGEFDDAFRKSAINLLGGLTGLPAAQINRTITGTQALADGETDNPAAVLFGYQE